MRRRGALNRRAQWRGRVGRNLRAARGRLRRPAGLRRGCGLHGAGRGIGGRGGCGRRDLPARVRRGRGAATAIRAGSLGTGRKRCSRWCRENARATSDAFTSWASSPTRHTRRLWCRDRESFYDMVFVRAASPKAPVSWATSQETRSTSRTGLELETSPSVFSHSGGVVGGIGFGIGWAGKSGVSTRGIRQALPEHRGFTTTYCIRSDSGADSV